MLRAAAAAFIRIAAGAAVAVAIGCGPATSAPATPAAAPDALLAGEHNVVVNGVRVWYRVAGTNAPGVPPVVFLHGGPGYNSHSFATLAGPRLEPALRMVYLDQRGSGRSERPWTGDYALATLVEDVEGVRRALGVPSIAIVAHSFGGVLGLEYAARYPDRVSRLVLVSAASDVTAACHARREWLAAARPQALARALAERAGRGEGVPGDCDLAFGTLQGREFVEYNDAVMFPDSAIRLRQDSVDAASGLRNTGELQGALIEEGLLTYRFAAPERLTMPVLILAGRHDSAIGLEQQRALAGALPNARFVEYERGGHFLYLDEPERFARDLEAFLATGGGATP